MRSQKKKRKASLSSGSKPDVSLIEDYYFSTKLLKPLL
jgi:hypothetical protein